MNVETKFINALCQNKDLNAVYNEHIVDLLGRPYQDVWQFIMEYRNKHRAVPDITVVHEQFPDVDIVETKGHTQHYIDDLKSHFIRSRLQNLMLDHNSRLSEAAPAEVLEKLIVDLSELNRVTDVIRDVDITKAKEAVDYYERQAQRAKEMGGAPGISTGFKAIDFNYPTGMAPGHLIVMIGWPGRGKTWFASYLAMRAWNNGFKPMVVSLEMSPEGMRDRIYTMMGEGLFRNSEFSAATLNIDSFKQWSEKKFSDKNEFIIVSSEGESGVTPNTVQAKIDQHRPDLVICDYHQLFEDNQHSGDDIRRGGNVSRQFKQLAVSNGIPLIDITAATMDDTSSQDDPPMLSQVRWSKSIEYDADMAMAVHRRPNSNQIDIISRKNRHGSEFALFLDWDIDRGIVKEAFDEA